MSKGEIRTYEFDLPMGEAITIVRLGGKAVRRRRITKTYNQTGWMQPDIEYLTVAIRCQLLDQTQHVYEQTKMPTRIPNVPYPLINDKSTVAHFSHRFETEEGKEFMVDFNVEQTAFVLVRNDENPPDNEAYCRAAGVVDEAPLDLLPCVIV
jgi:hypothetical protein